MRTILLVDDEEALLKMLKWRLEISGFNVVSALTADDALAYVENQAIDLVLTDIRMPKMDGLSLVRRIKQSLQNVPCLLMSGHGDIDVPEQAKQVGAIGYIHKPIKFEQLESLIEQGLASN